MLHTYRTWRHDIPPGKSFKCEAMIPVVISWSSKTHIKLFFGSETRLQNFPALDDQLLPSIALFLDNNLSSYYCECSARCPPLRSAILALLSSECKSHSSIRRNHYFFPELLTEHYQLVCQFQTSRIQFLQEVNAF